MNVKTLSFIVMNRELARETTFQSSPNFVFLMKGALIVCLFTCLTVKCTYAGNSIVFLISEYLVRIPLLDTMRLLY